MKATKYTYGSVGHVLSKLPMSARMKARKNFLIHNPNFTLKDHFVGSSTVLSMFTFCKTKEGSEYWTNIAKMQKGSVCRPRKK